MRLQRAWAVDGPDGAVAGRADIYSAQHERQWVDITGLAPGPAVMRAQANPLHCVLESDESNNSTTASRQIPGVRVADAAGTPAGIVLSGTVVAPDVPPRRSGGCVPGRTTSGCYVWASASRPLRFTVVREPAHGVVALAPDGGLRSLATYTPAAGFSGEDSFAYVATDARGLTSPPATARVHVPPAPAASPTVAPACRPPLTCPRRAPQRSLAGRAAGEHAGAPLRAPRAPARRAPDRVPAALSPRGRRSGADGARAARARPLPAEACS